MGFSAPYSDIKSFRTYAFWNFAKANPYRTWAPQEIDFLVSWQRRRLGKEPILSNLQKARCLFPWGALLKTILDRLAECDPEWLYTLLLDLRLYTVDRLESSCDNLMAKRTRGVHTQLAKVEWLDRVMQSISEFAALGTLEALQEAFSKLNNSSERPEIDALSLLFESINANRGAVLNFLHARELERVRRISPAPNPHGAIGGPLKH